MNQQTVDLLRYAEHEVLWEPLQHDQKGKVTFPPKPERTFWDKLDALNFNPIFGIAFKTQGRNLFKEATEGMYRALDRTTARIAAAITAREEREAAGIPETYITGGLVLKNPGPNHRECLCCHAFIPDGMATIITPQNSKSSDNSQRAVCPHCGGELSWQHN